MEDKNKQLFWDLSEENWVKDLVASTEVIKNELIEILGLPTDDVKGNDWFAAHPHYVNSALAEVSWKTYEFYFFTIKHKKHCEVCPETCRVLEQIPDLITAQFSFLSPKTHIKPHKGYSRMVLRNHLPLIVPEGDIGLKVGNETRKWSMNQLLSFDDSHTHEAWNLSELPRAVLMFDIKHPEWNYSAKEISTYKLKNTKDPFLLDIANNETWLNWLKQGYFPEN